MKPFRAVFLLEWRTQIRRPVFWIGVLAIALIAFWESFPFPTTLERLEQLVYPAYHAQRIFYQGISLLALLVIALASKRLPLERLLGINALVWTSPGGRPGLFLLAKFLGNYCAFGLGVLLLAVGGITIRAFMMPDAFEIWPFLKAFIFIGMIPLAYILVLTLACGAILGVRLGGVLLVVYVFLTIGFSGNIMQPALYRFIGNIQNLVYLIPSWQNRQIVLQIGWATLGFEVLVTVLLVLILPLVLPGKKES